MRKLLILLVFINMACTQAPAPDQAQIRFEDVSEESGMLDAGVNGAGVAFWDYDQDGDVDVYITNSDSSTNLLGIHNRLWENDGTGKFRDVSEERGVANLGGLGRGISWGDYDNDGDSDLVVGNMPNSDRGDDIIPATLYKNLLTETGEPNFENVTRAAGLMRAEYPKDARVGGFTSTSGGIAFADYNNDGALDVLYRTTDDDVDQALFRNNGDGTFTEVTTEAGVRVLDHEPEHDGQGASGWFDFDQDGHLDLLSPNDGSPNTLFRNNGDETFTDVTKNRQPPSGVPLFNVGNANGVCLGDIDNDGDVDVYFPNGDQGNRLIRNDLHETGAAQFTDITIASGTGDMGGARGCTMADYDNDGYLDIYVNNGGLSNVLFNDITDPDFSPFVQFYVAVEPGHNVLYWNNGDGTFTDVTESANADAYNVGVGVASGDVNGDGFPDIIATGRSHYTDGKLISQQQHNWLLLNQGNDNNWVQVKLTGTKSNRSAFNARVTVTSGDHVVTRELYSATGYNSVDDPALIFGLGDREEIDSVEVIWPSGTLQRVDDVSPGQTLTITEPE